MARPCVPHPDNAPGDFFVEDGCCTRCDMPFTVAPGLFGVSSSESHCVVKRQPQTADELGRMYEAIEVAELDCIHYKGSDRVIKLSAYKANIGARDKAPADAVRPTQPGWWKRLFIRLRL